MTDEILPVNKLKGKYSVLTFVEDLGGTEEEQTIIEAAEDEISYGGDEEILEDDDQFGVEVTQREVIGGAPFIETGAKLTPGNEALEESGVFDGDSWSTADRHIEAVRILVYDSSNLEDLEQVIEGEDVEAEWSDDASLPTDGYGSTGTTYHCNGGLSVHTEALDEYDVFAEA